MSFEHWWNDTVRGKQKYWGRNTWQWHSFHHKTHTDWYGTAPPPRDKRMAIRPPWWLYFNKIIFKTSVRTFRRTQSVSITKTNRLILCRTIITGKCDNQMKHTHFVTNKQRLNVKHVVIYTVTTVFKSVNIAYSSDKVLSSVVRDTQTARHITRGIKTNAVDMVKGHPSFERDCTSPFDLPAKSICYLEDRKVTTALQNCDAVRSQRCSLETLGLCVLRRLDDNVLACLTLTSVKMNHIHTRDLPTTNHHLKQCACSVNLCRCYGCKNWSLTMTVENMVET